MLFLAWYSKEIGAAKRSAETLRGALDPNFGLHLKPSGVDVFGTGRRAQQPFNKP